MIGKVCFLVIIQVCLTFQENINSTTHTSTQFHNQTTFPLRVPQSLVKHFESFYHRSREQRQLNNFRRERIDPGVYTCGQRASDMFINFINPKYADKDTTPGNCILQVDAINSNICQFRVDFVDSELLTPENGNCENQFFMVSGPVWPNGIRKICGINSDQHFYVHLDREGRMDQTIDFTVTTVLQRAYKFGVWITQIDCSKNFVIQAPVDCAQYYIEKEGTIKTFNFEGNQYLSNLDYKVCIRSQRDSCFIIYEADPNNFLFRLYINSGNRRFLRPNRLPSTPSGRGEEDCALDYIRISGGRGNATRFGPSYDRFCGGYLNIESNKDFSIPIYSQITSSVSSLQIVTTERNERLNNLINPRRESNGFQSPIATLLPFLTSGFSGSNSRGSRRINEAFVEAGSGMRLRYSHRTGCARESFF